MSRTTLRIDGMTCGHCVMTVKKALESVDGVTIEKVAVGSASVSYDPSVASPENIAEAVTETGYAAVIAA